MCYPARQGRAVVAGCAVPEDTVPALPAVPWPRSQPHSLWPLCSEPLHRAAGNRASCHSPMGTGMSPCEHVKDFGIKGLGFPGLYIWLPQNCSAWNWVYYSTLLVQLCKRRKSNLRKCAGKLNSFMVIRTTDICRVNPQNFLATHIQELVLSLRGQSEPLSITHCSTKCSKT